MTTPEKIQHLLLVRLDHVGDCVMTVPPIVRSLKNTYPDIKISLMTTHRNSELISTVEEIDQIMIYDAPWSVRPEGYSRTPVFAYISKLVKMWFKANVRKSLGRYDAVIFLSHAYWERFLFASLASVRLGFVGTYNSRRQRISEKLLTQSLPFDTSKHQLTNCYNLIECILPVQHRESKTWLRVSETDMHFGQSILAEAGLSSECIACLHPGGGHFRSWPEERFAEIALWLARNKSMKVAVIAGPREFHLAKHIQAKANHPDIIALMTPSYKSVMCLMPHVKLYIGNDTGPTHIAAACGVPTLAIFGPTSNTIFSPVGRVFKCIKIDPGCSPCRIPWKPVQSCERNLECLNGISVERVVQGIMELIDV
ncbi:glycosyltransferase family 9 protein [bacterium]|nr:glycosyltransferase family 9 protein [candidate division CSSED10-310 bacterium]